jgi:hypothetical protein
VEYDETDVSIQKVLDRNQFCSAINYSTVRESREGLGDQDARQTVVHAAIAIHRAQRSQRIARTQLKGAQDRQRIQRTANQLAALRA